MDDEPIWRWTDGRTILGLNGRYIARIWRDGESYYDMPKAARYVARHWEIEGYGDTPEAAIADLRTKFHGRIREPFA